VNLNDGAHGMRAAFLTDGAIKQTQRRQQMDMIKRFDEIDDHRRRFFAPRP
jgi:hypothetical protein